MIAVDASFFIALLNPKDQWHAQAVALVPRLQRNRPLVTHALVVGEVVSAIAPAQGGKSALLAYEHIIDNCDIIFPTQDEFEAGMQLVLRYDGRLSLSDTILINLAAPDPDHRIASFDEDFDGKNVTRMF